ncbi:DoxX family protein [Starkeya sp. ORNL1]|uniref:DoxX family protein n=1 Tax=Starkeya sp. ORNL1 TaxID=2709380 RepID=UPI00146459E5|nr:DoxX family protein [Starkeya sp. ORNL1]QJP15146.1 DoxX family protein [Starkeya sp. ORNL1]
MSMETTLASWTPRVLSLLRFMSGLLLLQHGTQKILSFPPSGRPPVEIASLTGVSGLIELVCGTLLVLGLFSRPAAFIASGFTAVAYFMVHAPQNFFPIINGGELAALYCFVFFYLFFAGPGPWSLDAQLKK